VREYYLAGLRDTHDETQWRTEICWPIDSSGRSAKADTGALAL
jgi:hypothetical protein